MRASVAGLPDSRTTISTIRSCLSTRRASARCTKRTRSSIDSVNALAFDSLADFAEHAYDAAEGERLVTEDHARFLGGAAGYAGHRQVHHDAQPAAELGVATPGTQWICALRRRARLSAGRF